jgi:hypothetical protein
MPELHFKASKSDFSMLSHMFLLTQIFKQRVEGVKNPHRITPDYFFIL